MSKTTDQTGPGNGRIGTSGAAPVETAANMSAPGAGGDGAAKPARPFPAQPRIQPMQATPRPVVRPFQAQSASQSAAAQAVPVQAQPIPVKPMPRAVPAGAPQPPAVRPSAPPPAPPRAPGGMAPANVRPTVPAANPRKRHWLLLASFLGIVVLPTIFWAWYLWARATDQYVSTVGFSVHKEEISPAIDLLGGLAPLAGGSGASDTDVLYEYIRSQDMVEKIDAQLDLRQKFSRDWPHDFVFAYDPDGQIEDLTDYWSRQVKVLYDTSSDLITLKINAFTAEDAQQIAAAVFQQSSDKINELSSIARNDSTRLARDELEQTRQDLTQVRQDMTQFRMRTQIVDPQADLTSQMGVLSGLQAQLAEALVAHDLLLDNARPTDHRVTQSQQKIDALRRLIDSERQKFGADGKGPTGESYSALMAEYEKLMVDREFAEGAYRAARVAYEAAMAEARRKSRYLAAHIEPKIAQSSQAPNRPWLLFVVAGLLLTCWSIIALIYYSIRDRA